MEVEIPQGKGQFWGLSGSLKSIGTLCCGVCSRRDHSVLNNGKSLRLLQLTAVLHGRCHIILLLVNNPPPCDAAFHPNSLTTF